MGTGSSSSIWTIPLQSCTIWKMTNQSWTIWRKNIRTNWKSIIRNWWTGLMKWTGKYPRVRDWRMFNIWQQEISCLLGGGSTSCTVWCNVHSALSQRNYKRHFPKACRQIAGRPFMSPVLKLAASFYMLYASILKILLCFWRIKNLCRCVHRHKLYRLFKSLGSLFSF
mgnify:CR=1 FL=1